MISAAVGLFVQLLHSVSFAQTLTDSTKVDRATATLTGFVIDATTEEPLIGARVEIPDLHMGAISKADGSYQMQRVPFGRYEILAKAVGFEDELRLILIDSSSETLDLRMKQKTVQGKQVLVEADQERETEQRTVSRVTLTQSEIARMPSIGEPDPFRVLQMLPGVKSLSEISSGLYIRGGAPDENLILLDRNVVYNPTHMFGFFSTFNSDAIKQVELIKGGFPAEYGGRLTGVVNVEQRDGRTDGLHGRTSISLISARQTLEFPLLDGSALISGRRTYLDAVLDATGADRLFSEEQDLPRYYFYDLNLRLAQFPGENDKLVLTGYLGNDKLSYPTDRTDINLIWGNKILGLEWTHLFSPKIFSTAHLGWSDYKSNSFGSFLNGGFEFTNAIRELTGKYELDYRPDSSHAIKAGVALSQFEFSYYNVLGSSNNPIKDTGGIPYYISLFAQDEWQPSARWRMNIGTRLEWLDRAKTVTVDPRFTISYALDPLWSLKFSSGVYHQFFHLVTIGELTFFDLWVPGTSPLPPSRSDQFILGLSGYPEEKYFTSVEVYYKRLNHVVQYNPTKFLSNDIEEVFPQGDGYAYGIELFGEKRIGAWSGWVGYTLAWVKQRFAQINDGRAFSPKYDQRHEVQLVLNYKLSDSWSIGATWQYATGQAYTAYRGIYSIELPEIAFQKEFYVPGPAGGERLPAYHRSDMNVVHTFKFFGHDAKASLQVFNVYSRRNVWFRAPNGFTRPLTYTDVTLLPIIPSLGFEVSY